MAIKMVSGSVGEFCLSKLTCSLLIVKDPVEMAKKMEEMTKEGTKWNRSC